MTLDKQVIVTGNGKHMRPLLCVLERYGIGTVDKYARGVWLSQDDLQRLLKTMLKDKTCKPNIHPELVEVESYRGTGVKPENTVVKFGDFLALFDGKNKYKAGEYQIHKWFIPEEY